MNCGNDCSNVSQAVVPKSGDVFKVPEVPRKRRTTCDLLPEDLEASSILFNMQSSNGPCLGDKVVKQVKPIKDGNAGAADESHDVNSNIKSACREELDHLYTIYGRMKYLFNRAPLSVGITFFPNFTRIFLAPQDFPFVMHVENSSGFLIRFHQLVQDNAANLRIVKEHLESLEETFPDEPLIQAIKGDVYRQMGLEWLAFDALDKVLKRQPSHLFALCSSGALCFETAIAMASPHSKELLNRGLAALDKALELAPFSLFALYHRAKIHYALGHLFPSCLDIDQAMKINPRDPAILKTYKTINDIVE